MNTAKKTITPIRNVVILKTNSGYLGRKGYNEMLGEDEFGFTNDITKAELFVSESEADRFTDTYWADKSIFKKIRAELLIGYSEQTIHGSRKCCACTIKRF